MAAQSKGKAKKNLVLVDGHAMAYRAHFAFAGQNLSDEEGRPTETVFGFFRMLAKLIQERNPTHLVLCFDPGREANPRYELYKDYKANRPPMPDELRRQIDDIQRIASAVGIPPLIAHGAEADDAIASIVEKHQNDFDKIEIVSGDKDLYNMLYKNVVLLRSKTGVTAMEEIDAAWVKNKLGISRSEVPDFMALVGDTSDNIPGVKGVGEKTAAKLIQEHKSLDGIFKHLEKIKPEGLKKKLEEGREMAYLSQKLVTLRKDIEVEKDDVAMEFSPLPDGGRIFQDLKLKSVATEWEKALTAHFGKPPSQPSEIAAMDLPSRRVSFCESMQVVKTEAELSALLKKLSGLETLCIDTETTGLQIHDSQIFGISLGWMEGEKIFSAYIPLPGDDTDSLLNADYADCASDKKILPLIKTFLEKKTPAKIGQNIKFDIQVFKKAGVEVEGYQDDTMLLSFLLNPNVRRHNMDAMAEDHLQYKTMHFDDLVGKGKARRPIGQIPLDKLGFYACEDAEVTLALFHALLPKVEKSMLETLYRPIDVPLAKVLASMEYTGVCIDVPYLAQLEKRYKLTIRTAQEKIYELAGEEFNIASPKQLQGILFQKLKIESTRKTEKGALSTDQSVLEELIGEHKIIEHILDYRFYTKLVGTYVEALPQHVSRTSGRVHTSLSQVTAATGRLSSLEPNLQNIPIKGEEGSALRMAFIASKGNSLLSLDYSQIELRILAHYSLDKHLVEAYEKDEDIHDRAAFMLFASRFDEAKNDFSGNERGIVFTVDQAKLQKMKSSPRFADMRSQAKVLNFSIVYGVTEFGLARNLAISRSDAKELMANYFSAFPGIKTYMQEAITKARETGYAENLFGRRRALTDIQNRTRFVREAAERLAINTPIQSTAADLIKKAMIEIDEKMRKAKMKSAMVLQIHDELLFDVAPGEESALESMARTSMEKIVSLRVPLKVSGNFGKNWNECK